MEGSIGTSRDLRDRRVAADGQRIVKNPYGENGAPVEDWLASRLADLRKLGASGIGAVRAREAVEIAEDIATVFRDVQGVPQPFASDEDLMREFQEIAARLTKVDRMLDVLLRARGIDNVPSIEQAEGWYSVCGPEDVARLLHREQVRLPADVRPAFVQDAVIVTVDNPAALAHAVRGAIEESPVGECGIRTHVPGSDVYAEPGDEEEPLTPAPEDVEHPAEPPAVESGPALPVEPAEDEIQPAPADPPAGPPADAAAEDHTTPAPGPAPGNSGSQSQDKPPAKPGGGGRADITPGPKGHS